MMHLTRFSHRPGFVQIQGAWCEVEAYPPKAELRKDRSALAANKNKI